MGSLEVFSQFYSILLLGGRDYHGFLAFCCVLATSRVILHAFVIDFFFPVRDLNVNFKITQELRMNTSSNTATHHSKSFKLTLWYSNIAADNSPNYKLQFMESPSVVTRKFPSDMTRTRFLGYDACPRL